MLSSAAANHIWPRLCSTHVLVPAVTGLARLTGWGGGRHRSPLQRDCIFPSPHTHTSTVLFSYTQRLKNIPQHSDAIPQHHDAVPQHLRLIGGKERSMYDMPITFILKLQFIWLVLWTKRKGYHGLILNSGYIWNYKFTRYNIYNLKEILFS